MTEEKSEGEDETHVHEHSSVLDSCPSVVNGFEVYFFFTAKKENKFKFDTQGSILLIAFV